jgi:hypothetical protein
MSQIKSPAELDAFRKGILEKEILKRHVFQFVPVPDVLPPVRIRSSMRLKPR